MRPRAVYPVPASSRAAAMKSLAVEYDARAYRFAASANGDISLGSDGYVRWLGAPIATLAASDDFLKPRVILLADEQLSGASRDMVDQRAARFVQFQIDQHLTSPRSKRWATRLPWAM